MPQSVMHDLHAATLLLMVGLPGAGKTTRAKELAVAHQAQFQVPDAAELAGAEAPGPPAGWPGWPEWAADRWPSLTDS